MNKPLMQITPALSTLTKAEREQGPVDTQKECQSDSTLEYQYYTQLKANGVEWGVYYDAEWDHNDIYLDIVAIEDEFRYYPASKFPQKILLVLEQKLCWKLAEEHEGSKIDEAYDRIKDGEL